MSPGSSRCCRCSRRIDLLGCLGSRQEVTVDSFIDVDGQVPGVRFCTGFLSFQYVAVEIDAAQHQETLTGLSL